MDREKFVEELHKMDPDYNPGYVKRPTEIDDVMQACIDHAKNNYMRDDNMYQFAVVIEEMAELTQELTKMLRGRDNRTGVVEELADVQLCVWVTMKMLGITDEEINQAIQVKSDRQRNKKCKKKSNNVPKELAALYTKKFENSVKNLSDFDKKAIYTILDRDEWSVRQLPALSSDSDSDKLAFVVNAIGYQGRSVSFDKLRSMIVESKFINFNRYTFDDSDECELILTQYRKIIEDCIFDMPVLRAAIKRMFYLLNL